MIRTIRIWSLLRRLQKACHEAEIENSDHHESKGHNFHAHAPEQDFLSETSASNKKKRAEYVDFLKLAEKKMNFLDVSEKTTKCAHPECKEVISERWICLNEDGLEFIGVFDLIEYILVKYKRTWILFLSPIAFYIIELLIRQGFEIVSQWNMLKW